MIQIKKRMEKTPDTLIDEECTKVLTKPSVDSGFYGSLVALVFPIFW